MLIFSELESRRFNLNIFRANAESIFVDNLNKQIIDNDIDISIIRLSVDDKVNHSELLKIQYPYIHADTLVYYSFDLKNNNISALKNDLYSELIDENNSSFLEEIIPVVFKNYQNHYFSNPFLDKSFIVDGYIEWSKTFTVKSLDRISWYFKINDDIIGFATCLFNSKEKTCEGVLYGVLPDYSGQGIYSDIIRFTQSYFKNLGYMKMDVSTQIQNFTVQRVWSREGFVISRAYDTFHINSFLKKNKLK